MQELQISLSSSPTYMIQIRRVVHDNSRQIDGGHNRHNLASRPIIAPTADDVVAAMINTTQYIRDAEA
jgi:hypothetical protein